jgi:tetratricopeptide (TPR) repeat protein
MPPIRRKTIAALAVLAIALTAGTPSALARKPSAERLEPALSPAGNFLAAIVAGASRDIASEAAFLREALAGDPSDSILLLRALTVFVANGDINDAVIISQRLLRVKPAPDEVKLARVVLAVDAMRNRRFREAANLLEPSAAAAGEDPSAPMLRAWAKIGAGRPKEALALIAPYESGQAAGLATYMKGLIGVVIRDRKLAETNLQAAYERSRTDIRTADAFARVLAGRGDLKAASAIYAAFDAREPAYALIADPIAMLADGKAPGPLVRSAQDGAAELLFVLSDVGGDPSPASRLRETISLQLAVHLSPNDPVLRAAVAQSYDGGGQTARAIEAYADVPRRSRFRASSDIRRVQALQRLDRNADARELVGQLLKERPKDLDLLATYGQLHSVEKRWPEAINAYSRAIEVAGTPKAEHWNLYFGRGIAHERVKDWAKSEADLKQALALLPEAKAGQPSAWDRARILNYLAYTWVDRHENIDQAFVMLKEAVDLTQGRNGDIVDSLGWAHYRLGQYEQAVIELEKAVALNPGEAVINDHLGDAYWRVGRRLEARFKWNHARDLKPEPEDLKRILDKIENGLKDTPKAAGNGQTGDGG